MPGLYRFRTAVVPVSIRMNVPIDTSDEAVQYIAHHCLNIDTMEQEELQEFVGQEVEIISVDIGELKQIKLKE